MVRSIAKKNELPCFTCIFEAARLLLETKTVVQEYSGNSVLRKAGERILNKEVRVPERFKTIVISLADYLSAAVENQANSLPSNLNDAKLFFIKAFEEALTGFRFEHSIKALLNSSEVPIGGITHFKELCCQRHYAVSKRREANELRQYQQLNSDKFIAAQRRYEQSEKGKRTSKKYKGKAAVKRRQKQLNQMLSHQDIHLIVFPYDREIKVGQHLRAVLSKEQLFDDFAVRRSSDSGLVGLYWLGDPAPPIVLEKIRSLDCLKTVTSFEISG